MDHRNAPEASAGRSFLPISKTLLVGADDRTHGRLMCSMYHGVMLALDRSTLFRIAVGGVVSVACGVASTIPGLEPIAVAVAQLVAGLGVNYISERLSTLPGPGTAGVLPTLSDDLGRVTKYVIPLL